MKTKNLLFMAALTLGLGFTMVSCSDDEKEDDVTLEDAAALNYNSENAAAWGNYAKNVALLLKNDAENLNNQWQRSFAEAFKAHSPSTGYTSAQNCVEEILQGCIDIANEVGTAKIGEPVDYWTAGKTLQAVYAVESWYSWHSRDDYKNNILSVANSLLGRRLNSSPNEYGYSNAASETNSIVGVCAASDNKELNEAIDEVWNNVMAAWNAIDAIPQPFRNNIGSKEAAGAMTACAELVESLETLQGKVKSLSEKQCQSIVDTFVDVVALPTYAELASKNAILYETVAKLQANPSNATFAAACEAWLDARKPWETSEAFLFGPVATLGLDPNMDSWPLDQVGIYNIMKSQNWGAFEWNGEYDEDNEAIEAAQSLRGFHTLEFLLFKDGQPRRLN